MLFKVKVDNGHNHECKATIYNHCTKINDICNNMEARSSYPLLSARQSKYIILIKHEISSNLLASYLFTAMAILAKLIAMRIIIKLKP